jgi:hypothetical protein
MSSKHIWVILCDTCGSQGYCVISLSSYITWKFAEAQEHVLVRDTFFSEKNISKYSPIPISMIDSLKTTWIIYYASKIRWLNRSFMLARMQ